ncbi:MAG: COG1361 S-layer family protein [Candidatus Bilamarchaeaceae archaeon]
METKNMTGFKALLLALLLFGLAFPALSLTNYTVSPATITPGGSGVITLSLSNPSSTSGTNLKIEGLNLNLYPDAYIGTKDNIYVGDLDIGSSTIVTIPIVAKDNAKSGVYLVEIKTYGSNANAISFKGISIPVKITNKPIISLSADKTEIKDIDTMTLNLANNGGGAKRVTIKIVSPGFSFQNANQVYVDMLEKDAKVQFGIDGRDAVEGVNDLNFSITYHDEIGDEYMEYKTLRVTLKKEKLDLIFDQDSDVTARVDSDLVWSIKNNGKDLSDVKFTFYGDDITPTQTSEIKLGDFASGDTKTVDIPVRTSLTPGVNNIYLMIKWTEGGVEKEQKFQVPLIVSSDSDIQVYMEAKPTPLTAGGSHTISFVVSNVGSYQINSVDVGFNSTALENQEIQNTQYIGGLEKDDFSSVQFKAKVAGVAPGEYPIDINVRYRDASGVWKTKTVHRMINISAPEGDGNGSGLIWVVLAALAIAGVWWFKFRKRPEKKLD